MPDRFDAAQELQLREIAHANRLRPEVPPAVDWNRVCGRCQEPIGAARLSAVPYATNCTECARLLEAVRSRYRP